MNKFDQFIKAEVPLQIASTPEGMDALFIAQTLNDKGGTLLHIARDDHRMSNLSDLVAFFAPDTEILTFPAWDCLPYDRVSPNPDISAQRMTTLSKLAAGNLSDEKRLIITTINAVTQRVPERDTVKDLSFSAKTGDQIDVEDLSAYLTRNGYVRSSTVVEHGDFAIRGGLIDIFPSGQDQPVRIDLWGDTIDVIREFDPISQRTAKKVDDISFVPMSEVTLNEDSIRRFRGAYVRQFGTVLNDDPLYEAVKDGRKHQGMEHWLPYFHFRLETLFDYLPNCPVTMDHLTTEALADRLKAIEDYYQARKEAYAEMAKGASSALSTYKPLPPEKLYLNGSQWQTQLDDRKIHQFGSFKAPPDITHMDMGGKVGRDFAPERNDPKQNVYDALRKHCVKLHQAGRQVLIASYSAGSQNRLAAVLVEHGMSAYQIMDRWASRRNLTKGTIGLIILPSLTIHCMRRSRTAGNIRAWNIGCPIFISGWKPCLTICPTAQ